jgi:aminoglycoside 6-adenylyltransferase
MNTELGLWNTTPHNSWNTLRWKMKMSLLEKVIALADANEDVQAVILEGSLAAGFQVDELSDYDINVYTRNAAKYLDDDRWMARIGEVMVYEKTDFPFQSFVVPTRLVVFRDRQRIDFSFWPPDLLAGFARGEKLYEGYRNGYRVLLDKDALAACLPPPDGGGFSIAPPGPDQFKDALYDFWFEAYSVARYLSRSDLWFAKKVENGYAKELLYQVALWDHQAARGWKPDPILHLEGKRFEKWAPPELIEAVSRCFSPFDLEETWKSLLAMVATFNRLARRVAKRLQFEYPEQNEKDVLDYIHYLENRTYASS